MPPLIHKFFSIPEIFWKTETFIYKAFRFGPVRQKISTKPWCPLLCMKIFDERIFLKHQIVLQWNISVKWDKIFSAENRDTPPPLLSIKFFSLPENFWNTEWFPGEVFSGLSDKKNSTKLWSFPPILLDNFQYQNSFETQKCSPTNFTGTVRQKIFNGV